MLCLFWMGNLRRNENLKVEENRIFFSVVHSIENWFLIYLYIWICACFVHAFGWQILGLWCNQFFFWNVKKKFMIGWVVIIFPFFLWKCIGSKLYIYMPIWTCTSRPKTYMKACICRTMYVLWNRLSSL